jgi:3'(2'), 5'-bisphosphate nucleotidase
MLDIHHPETRFALESVRQASYLVRQVQADLVGATLSKSDHSPVTVGDYAAQALIGSLLERYYPDDALVAEEDSQTLCSAGQEGLLELVTGFVAGFARDVQPEQVCRWIERGQSRPVGRYWTLDPIDGTKGYLRGDQYAVALALIEHQQVQLGVLGCPNLTDGFRPDLGGPGSLVIARRGQGAWTTSLASAREFDPLHVSGRADPTLARLLRSFEAQHTNVGRLDELVSHLGIQADPVRLDSQAKYAILAAGKAEVMLRLLSEAKPNYREKVWDIAAGSIVVEEAGGRVTDLHGKALDFSTGREFTNNRGILATNGHLHQAFLDALARLGV